MYLRTRFVVCVILVFYIKRRQQLTVNLTVICKQVSHTIIYIETRYISDYRLSDFA